MSVKKRAGVFLLLFFLLVLPLTVWSVGNLNFETRKKAAPISSENTPEQPAKPDFVPGEVIVKFKTRQIASGVDFDKQPVAFSEIEEKDIPQILKTVNQKYKIEKIEKVFKGASDPQTELNKFKEKFAKEIAGGKRKINEQELLKIDLSNVYKISFDKKVSINNIIGEISKDLSIEYAEPNYIYRTQAMPNDPYYLDHYPDHVGDRDPNWNPPYDYLWDMKKIKVAEAWNTTSGSEDVMIAVIDTGVDYNHPELQGKVVLGHDYANNDEDPMDDNGHGTHCAGTIAAKANNSIGIVGVCPNCKILAIKALDNSGSGSLFDLSQAIREASNKNARVINASWGAEISGDLVIDEAIEYARSLGTIMIAAAGNENADTKFFYPASNPGVIAVSATDQNDQKASFSNYGDRIDVSAPGGMGNEFDGQSRAGANILSLRARGIDPYGDGKTIVGQEYLRLRGTSMAAPHVSGLVGLLFSFRPDWQIEEVRQVVRSSADDIGAEGWDIYNGYGRINVFRAINVGSVNTAKIFSPKSNAFMENTVEIKGIAAGSSFFSYSLEYGQGTEPSQWTTIVVGNSPKLSITEELGEISSRSFSAGFYTIRLRVNSSDPSIPVAEDRLILRKIPMKWYLSGDRFSNEIFLWSNPVLTDLNKDGDTEILVGTSDTTYVISSTGEVLRELSTSEYYAGGYITANVGDLEGDGNKEIISQTKQALTSGALRLFKQDDTEITNNNWPKNVRFGSTYPNFSNTLVDVNNDDRLEILGTIYNGDGTWGLYLWNNEGRLYNSSWPKERLRVTSALAGRITDKESLQIITIDMTPTVHVYSPEGLEIAHWSIPVPEDEQILGPPDFITLSDVDKDGLDEILTTITVLGPEQENSTVRVYLYVYKGNGQLLLGERPVIVDRHLSYNQIPIAGFFNKTNVPQIVLTTNYGIEVRNLDGSLAWSKDIGTTAAGATLYDIDGDGNLEIAVTRVINPAVFIYRSDGTSFEAEGLSNPIELSGRQGLISPLIADIDNDNHIELVVHTMGGGIGAFDLGIKNWPQYEKADWPMFMQNERHNGVTPNICDINRDLSEDNRDVDLFNLCKGRTANSINELKECMFADVNHEEELIGETMIHNVSDRDERTLVSVFGCNYSSELTPSPTPSNIPTPEIICPNRNLGNLDCDANSQINQSDLQILLDNWKIAPTPIP